MSHTAAPHLKSLPAPDQPCAAEPAALPVAEGGPRNVGRRPSPSALCPNPHRGDGRYPIAWLYLTAPGRGATPTARSWCACGHDRSAVGTARVLALIDAHTAHRDRCPLRTSPEGRAAA